LSESLFERLDSIKLRLTELQQEDDKSATEIKTDLFILVKVTGEFDEYLEPINDITFTHKRLVLNTGHIEKIRTFNAARENLLRIVETIQKEISAKEEHDAMMRSFHGVPLAHKLETMPDIDLAEFQSRLAPNSPGKIIIENEWQRRKSSKTSTPTPTEKPLTIIQKINHWYRGNEVELIPVKNGNFVDIYARYEKSTSARVANGLVNFWLAHWQWIITTLIAVSAIFATLFVYFDSKAERNAEKKASNQISPARQQSPQVIIHNQSTSSRPMARPKR